VLPEGVREPERCPLCQTPRAPGATRCPCNYVFAYGAPVHAVAGPAVGHGKATMLLLAVAAVALVLGLLGLRSNDDLAGHGNLGLLLMPVGAFTVCGALMNWAWFFNARKARFLVMIVGRIGARIFYAAVGGALVGAGIALLMA
jgi:hypothetical protein